LRFSDCNRQCKIYRNWLFSKKIILGAAIVLFLKQKLSPLLPRIFAVFQFFLFIFFSSRPPLGGIDDGAGGFAQRRDAALLGNDGEQRLYGLEKL